MWHWRIKSETDPQSFVTRHGADPNVTNAFGEAIHVPMCNDQWCRKPTKTTKTAIVSGLCQAPLELAVRGAIEIPPGGLHMECSKEIGKPERSTCLTTFLYFSPFCAIMLFDEHDFVLHFYFFFWGGGVLDVAISKPTWNLTLRYFQLILVWLTGFVCGSGRQFLHWCAGILGPGGGG